MFIIFLILAETYASAVVYPGRYHKDNFTTVHELRMYSTVSYIINISSSGMENFHNLKMFVWIPIYSVWLLRF